MIAKIIEFSARSKFAVLLVMALALIWGYWALKNTPLDALPDLSDTQVIIYTEWVGRSPDLVEENTRIAGCVYAAKSNTPAFYEVKAVVEDLLSQLRIKSLRLDPASDKLTAWGLQVGGVLWFCAALNFLATYPPINTGVGTYLMLSFVCWSAGCYLRDD